MFGIVVWEESRSESAIVGGLPVCCKDSHVQIPLTGSYRGDIVLTDLIPQRS